MAGPKPPPGFRTSDPLKPNPLYDPKDPGTQHYEEGTVELFDVTYRYQRGHLLKPAEQIMVALLQDILDTLQEERDDA